MLIKSELLDRMEILYPYKPVFGDLRRAYIDRDLSSMFRVFEEIWQVSFDDVRRTVMEKDLHSLFRLWEQYPHIRDDLRKATLEDNLWSLFRLFDPDEPNVVDDLHLEEEGFDPRDFKKFVMDDNTWSMYRMMLHIQDTQIVRTVKSFHAKGIRFEKDSLSRGQLQSKMWLIQELKRLDLDLGTVFLCAGWYGILAVLMFEHELNIDKIRSFDLDPEVADIADKFNLPWLVQEWKFKASTCDIHDIDWPDFHYDVVRSDGSQVTLRDRANTVINTSCEHIEQFEDWYQGIPTGTLVILQSNDYDVVPEHVNTVPDLHAFEQQTPMSEVLYNGELNLGHYNRFMRIGYK